MGGCTGHSCHVFLLLSFQSVHPSSTPGEERRGCSVSPASRLYIWALGERPTDHLVNEHFLMQESRVSHSVLTSLLTDRPHGPIHSPWSRAPSPVFAIGLFRACRAASERQSLL